jgi:hypothetical protein
MYPLLFSLSFIRKYFTFASINVMKNTIHHRVSKLCISYRTSMAGARDISSGEVLWTKNVVHIKSQARGNLKLDSELGFGWFH